VHYDENMCKTYYLAMPQLKNRQNPTYVVYGWPVL